jgi:hypothetical protein
MPECQANSLEDVYMLIKRKGLKQFGQAILNFQIINE